MALAAIGLWDFPADLHVALHAFLFTSPQSEGEASPCSPSLNSGWGVGQAPRVGSLSVNLGEYLLGSWLLELQLALWPWKLAVRADGFVKSRSVSPNAACEPP